MNMRVNKDKPATRRAPTEAPALPGNDRVAWLGRFGWLPVPLLVLGMAAVWAADLRTSYESRDLLLALNFVFSSLASLFVAYLVARSFLVSGMPGLLMLGCGVVLWGCSGFVGTVAGLADTTAAQDFANMNVTIHNICVWLSAVCHLVGVIFLLRPKRTVHAAGLALSAAYTGALGAVGLVTLSALAQWTPTFIVQGQGGTLVRQFVLGSAIVMFAFTAFQLIGTNRRSPSPFTHWYGLALALIAAGLLGIMMEPSAGSPLSWLGRAAQYVGGVYMLIAGVMSVRQSQVWGIPLERALREERNFAKTVLETAGALVVVLDRQGRIRRFNRACEETTGYSAAEVQGRVLWEFLIPPGELAGVKETWEELTAGNFPNKHENHWLAKDGAQRLIAWSNTALTDDAGEVLHTVAIGIDITERKRREEQIAKLTKLYAVLSRVDESIVRTHDAGSLYRDVCRIVAEEGEFPLVWIGVTEDTQVVPAAWWGLKSDYM